jgi:hypothetical protein
MRKTIIILMLLNIINASCQNSNEYEKIEGDIYIKLIDLGSLYPLTENEIDEKLALVKDETLLNYFNTLKDYDLLDKPFFNLRLNDEKVIKVFTSIKEYQKLAKYNNFKDLDRASEKIRVKLDLKEIKIKNETLYFSNNIISTLKVKGITRWSK